MSVRETAGHLVDGLKQTGEERARAYVEIQNGCDHRCTFCIIPYGRGNSRSAAAGEVVEQVRRLAAAGFNEVVLTGVDLTSWGADLPGGPTLGQLVGRILRLVPELARLRLSSIDAAEIDADLLRCLAEEARLAPHLHLSLQSGDDLILKRMKRRHSSAPTRCGWSSRCGPCGPTPPSAPTSSPAFPPRATRPSRTPCGSWARRASPTCTSSPSARGRARPPRACPRSTSRWSRLRAERLRAEGGPPWPATSSSGSDGTAAVLVERETTARAADFTEVALDRPATPGEIVRVKLAGHDGARALGRLQARIL